MLFHKLIVGVLLSIATATATSAASASYKIVHSQDQTLCEQVRKHFENKAEDTKYGEYNSDFIHWIKGAVVERESIRSMSFFDDRLKKVVLGENPLGKRWGYKPYDIEYITLPIDKKDFSIYKFKSLDSKYSDFCRFLPDELNHKKLSSSFFEAYKNHYIYTRHCNFFSEGERMFHVEFLRHLQLQISVRELHYDISKRELVSNHKCDILAE